MDEYYFYLKGITRPAIYCEQQSSLSKTDSLSLNQSGAFSKLLLRTQQIIVTAQPGVLGQNGNFSDPTCQKDSPNRYILAVNPRPTSGLMGEVKGSRVTEPKAGTSRQLFPRTRTVYEQT